MKTEIQESKQEVIESMDQFTSAWKVFVGEYPNADIVDRPGLSIRWNASSFPFWHAVFLTEHMADAETLAHRIHEGSGYMRMKNESGLLWVCEDYLGEPAQASLQSNITKEKLEPALTATGMAGEILPLIRLSHPDLRVEPVADTDQLIAYADINSEAYGFPIEWGRSGLSRSKLWKTAFYSYLGYEGNRPVSAASAVVNDGIIFLALVATRPDAQHKGYAEVVVRHALQAAHEATGLTRTVLHASDAGLPVYRRVGYHETCKIHAYRLAAGSH
jgi:GNAT superfamily N-acetyltransferase